MSGLTISPYPHSLFYVGLWEHPGFRISAMSGLRLPGVEPGKRAWFADRRCPDELAALYDDVTHEMRVGAQLFSLALEDSTRVQASLL